MWLPATMVSSLPSPSSLRTVLTQVPAQNGDESWELPMPGTFVIAQDGVVRLAFVDADWTKRLEPAAILESLHRIAGR